MTRVRRMSRRRRCGGRGEGSLIGGLGRVLDGVWGFDGCCCWWWKDVSEEVREGRGVFQMRLVGVQGIYSEGVFQCGKELQFWGLLFMRWGIFCKSFSKIAIVGESFVIQGITADVRFPTDPWYGSGLHALLQVHGNLFIDTEACRRHYKYISCLTTDNHRSGLL